MRITPAKAEDAEDWLAMRHVLWPEGSISEHRGDILEFDDATAKAAE